MSEAVSATESRAAGSASDGRAGLEASLWSKTSAPVLPLSVLRGRRDVEVAIVGAGFTGLTAALALRERGAEVAILDAREPGFGASGRNGGQIVPAFKRDPAELVALLGEEAGRGVIDMVVRSADVVFDLIDRYRIDCEAVRTGWIQGARSTSSENVLRRRSEVWRHWGASVRWLDSTEIARLSGSRWFRGGWALERGGSVHPLKYVRGLAQAAHRLGASLFRDSPAVGLERHGAVWRVTTPEGELRAERVILATNGYTTPLWPGLRETIIPLYSMQVATEPLSESSGAEILPGRQTMTDARHLVNYFRRDAQGRFIIGGRGPYRDDLGPFDVRGLVAMARRLYPQLEEVAFPHRWAGRVAMTKDSIPHLHRLAPGLTAALGYNGRGVAMASAMGRVLAAASLDDRGLEAPIPTAPYPVTPLAPIPFHRLHRAGVQLMIWYYRAADRLA